MKVSIIGTGQIGKDLLCKLSLLNFVKIVAFVGRRKIKKEELPKISCIDDIIISDKSIDFFIENNNCCDVVFDCTDAYSAIINNNVFEKQNILVIDMTPSKIGDMYVPNITPINKINLNMITCGAQASLPMLNYFKNILECIEYIEVITQISSESAGMATRINIDKYIETTENAISEIIGIKNNKVILNLNPSKNAYMKTTIYITTKNPINLDDFNHFDDFDNFVKSVKEYIPNYNVSKPTKFFNNILTVNINLKGSGNYLLNKYGNLDIINCAAINVLKELSENSILYKNLQQC